MNKSKLVLVAAIAVLGTASSALAKSIPGHHAYRPDRVRVARSPATAYPRMDGRQSGLHSFATVPGSSDFQMQLRMDREDF